MSQKQKTPAAFDDDPADMTNAQLEKQHSDLLHLQKQEITAENQYNAKKMAKRRQELWNEAAKRDIENRLLD